jgi:hypothetical protein
MGLLPEVEEVVDKGQKVKSVPPEPQAGDIRHRQVGHTRRDRDHHRDHRAVRCLRAWRDVAQISEALETIVLQNRIIVEQNETVRPARKEG